MSWDAFDFARVGGVRLAPNALASHRLGMGETPVADAGVPVWNFGWSPPEPGAAPAALRLGVVAPHLAGGWDGRTSFSLWEVGKRVTGEYLKAQRQTLGTCVSRGYSACGNLSQLAMIAAGLTKPDGTAMEFREVAHAPIYGGSRELGNFLAPPGNDGSVGEWAARWVSKWGNCSLADLNDSYDSDKLAGQMGWRGVPSNVKELCREHLVSSVALVKTFQEAADAIVNGHPVAVCSDQGFTMRRDGDGFDRPYGSWAHCMHFASVIVTPSGRRGLGCGQSWGGNNPSGTLLPGAPDHVFGVDEATVNRMLRQGDSYALAGFNGWSKKAWPLDWVLWG